jgi:hypothetical protein
VVTNQSKVRSISPGDLEKEVYEILYHVLVDILKGQHLSDGGDSLL